MSKGECLEKRIQEFCCTERKDEGKLWEELVEVYRVTFWRNLEFTKKQYCNDNKIGFLHMWQYLDILGEETLTRMEEVFEGCKRVYSGMYDEKLKIVEEKSCIILEEHRKEYNLETFKIAL